MNEAKVVEFDLPLAKLQKSGAKHGALPYATDLAKKLKKKAAEDEAYAKTAPARREAAGAAQIQAMHGEGSHETSAAYSGWMQKQDRDAQQAAIAKKKASAQKGVATRAETAAKKRLTARGFNDTHKNKLGGGSWIEAEKFVNKTEIKHNRAEYEKSTRPKPAPKAPAVKAGPAVSGQQMKTAKPVQKPETNK